MLRADVVQHFASVNHAILLDILRRRIPEPDVMRLVETIVDNGGGVLDDEYRTVRFPGDDLLAVCRPRGLPIGNLTSQFWSNCYLHPFDVFVKRELGGRAYREQAPETLEEHQAWDIVRAVQNHIRVGSTGHVLGLDLGLAIELSRARDFDLEILSELLPAAEAGLLDALNHRDD